MVFRHLGEKEKLNKQHPRNLMGSVSEAGVIDVVLHLLVHRVVW